MTSQPSLVSTDLPFGLTVAVEDAYGNVATGFIGNLAIAPTNVSAEGNLGGVLTVPVVNGVAAFTDLRLEKAGTAFTLGVYSTGLPSVTTSPFTVSDTGSSGTSDALPI